MTMEVENKNTNIMVTQLLLKNGYINERDNGNDKII